MSANDKDSLVIMLHGVGSNGADLMGLSEFWKSVLPNTKFVSPDAPQAVGGGRFQWFSVAGVTPENRPQRIAEARAGFDAVVGQIIADEGFEGRLDRVAFVGFSQGTIMTLDAIATGRWPAAAAVGFSGRLASAEPLTPSLQTRVALIHGEADPVIPASESRAAAERLTGLGLAVELLTLPGVGHTISGPGAEKAGDVLAAALTA